MNEPTFELEDAVDGLLRHHDAVLSKQQRPQQPIAGRRVPGNQEADQLGQVLIDDPHPRHRRTWRPWSPAAHTQDPTDPAFGRTS
jgi:hypothetical protein